jgi:hypothetical protein
MGIIGKLDGDIETRNNKKRQPINIHEERTGDSVKTENEHASLMYTRRISSHRLSVATVAVDLPEEKNRMSLID